MRTRPSSRILLVGLLGLLSTASVITFFTACRGIAQQPAAKQQSLPDGLRHVPPDAMGFIHFRAGDFLKTEVGKSLLAELRKDREASKGLKKIEQTVGVEAADIDTVTLIMLAPGPRSPFDGPGRPIYPRGSKYDFKDFKDKMPLPPPGLEKDGIKDKAKEIEKEKLLFEAEKPAGKESPVVYQPIQRHMHDSDEFGFGEFPEFGGPLVIVTSTKPLDRKKMLRSQLFGPKAIDVYGPPQDPSVLFLSDRSVLLGMSWDIGRYSEAMARKTEPKNQPMKSALALGAESHLIVAGGHVPENVRRMLFMPFNMDMRELAPLSPLLMTEAGLALDFGNSLEMKLQFNAPTDASALNAEQAVKSLKVMAELALEKSQEGGESGGWKLQLEKAIAKALADVRIEKKDTTVSAQIKLDVSPAVVKHFSNEIVTHFRHSGDRTRSVNNLKQIGLALHSHHDVYKRMPAAGIGDRDGKPLLSWRVAILPFIEQQQLYQQFDLNQPWDHPTNKKLIAKMPAIYMVPGADAKEGETNYRVFVGPNTMFGERMGVRFTDVTDGTSNTFMVVEARDATIWTKPDDLPFDGKGALPKLGVTGDGFNALLADGSVRFVRPTVPEDVIRTWIIRNSGQIRQPID